MEMNVSVAVPVRRAQATIESTVEAAIAQVREVGGEVIVAVWRGDPTLAILQSLAGRHQGVLKLIVADDPCGIPQLRRDAVRAAIAPWVVITEDHCLFPPGWVKRMLADARGVEVRGGGVRNARGSYAGWAQYFTRYSAFLPPAPEGTVTHLPGNSSCYSRRLLDSPLLQDGFWEAEFNHAAGTRGVRLVSDPALTIEQRQHRGWFEFIPLRFRHGRCYGGRRGASNIAHLMRIPLVPAILLLRIARAVLAKRGYAGWFLLTAPLIACYVLAWTFGEATGYLFGAGDSCFDTD
jgi:hypothetical protein